MTEELTPPEERTYQLLCQVCQTYLDEQDLSLLELYSTIVMYLGEVSLQWLRLHDTPHLVARLMAALTDRLRTRLATGAGPLFQVPPGDPMRTTRGLGPSWGLTQALIALVNDSGAAYQIDVAGGLRMVLSLLADVLHAWSQTFDKDGEEMVELIATSVTESVSTYIAQRLPACP